MQLFEFDFSSQNSGGSTLPAPKAPDKVSGLFHAGSSLRRFLEKARPIDAKQLRRTMVEAFAGTGILASFVCPALKS